MPAGPVLHATCHCGRTVTIPYREEWEGLLREELLARLRCKACGQRARDFRRGWAVATLEETGGKR